MRLRKEHIQSEWSEGDDSYWIALKPGFKWAGDYWGAVHSIHEANRQAAHKETILPCECGECIAAGRPWIITEKTSIQGPQREAIATIIYNDGANALQANARLIANADGGQSEHDLRQSAFEDARKAIAKALPS